MPTARYVVLYLLVPQIISELHRYARSKVIQLTSSMKPLKELKSSLFPLVSLERYDLNMTLIFIAVSLIIFVAWCKFFFVGCRFTCVKYALDDP